MSTIKVPGSPQEVQTNTPKNEMNIREKVQTIQRLLFSVMRMSWSGGALFNSDPIKTLGLKAVRICAVNSLLTVIISIAAALSAG
jgi:hypothetical protein